MVLPEREFGHSAFYEHHSVWSSPVGDAKEFCLAYAGAHYGHSWKKCPCISERYVA